MLITKPGYEKTVTHRHTVPDECTILDFKKDFYEEILEEYGYLKFLLNNDNHSAFIKTSAETELLHRFVIREVQTIQRNKLEIDSLVIDLVATAFGKITSYIPNQKITERLKQNHLGTIERGKDFIAKNFMNDISLKEIADHCFVSSFHFGRIFKTITGYPPHRFLLHIRLKNAALLLKNTKSKILDVAFSSGFNSLEHFSAAFKLHYGYAPRSLKA
jgi:AraC-like DNA-binding protein